MHDLVERLTTMFPEIAKLNTWIAILYTILITAIGDWVIRRFISGRYEWKLLAYVLLTDVGLAILMLFFEVGWWWYFLLVFPFSYFIVRYICIRREWKKNYASLNGDDKDKVRYQYLMKLEKRNLCSWEVKNYLLPAMNILFKIGAMKHLDERLESMKEVYGNLYEWKRLKSYLYSNRQEYQQMLDILRPFENDKRLSKNEHNRTFLNIFHAYRMLDNEEGVRSYISEIEQMFFGRNEYSIEALDDLLYHYEITHNEEGVKRILDISSSINPEDFSMYLEFLDLQYMHNKRIDNRESNIQLLDKMMERHEQMQENDEVKLRFGLRVLKLYFENNYRWQEISLMMFSRAEIYLTYSRDIAFEYMEAVMLVIQNAQSIYNLSLLPEQLKHLFSTIRKHIDSYMLEYDRIITTLPDDFVYRKKEMLMRKVTYARLNGNLINDAPAYIREVCRLENQIIQLCHHNGEEREELHFLVVLTDDILAYYDTIQIDIANGVLDKDILKAQQEHPIYMEQIKKNMEKINAILRANHYNRSMAYYIFYQSYFNYKLGNIDNAQYALHKFHGTNVSIKNFTVAIQSLYQQVVKGLQMAGNYVVD